MFPTEVEAVVLAGGPPGDLEPEMGESPAGKGLVTVCGIPMAALTLQALVGSERVRRVVVVSPAATPPLSGPEWAGMDVNVEAGESMMDSFCRGLEAANNPESPVLVCCGDLPLLSREAVTDFVQRCSERPEAAIWYGYLRRENSERRFPGMPHTWAKLKDGTFCGTGMMMLRPRVVTPVRAAMDGLTQARKNVMKLASCLGWWTVFSYLIGRLTVRKAELAGTRIFGVPCVGVESTFPETGFNVDDNESLRAARKLLLQD